MESETLCEPSSCERYAAELIEEVISILRVCGLTDHQIGSAFAAVMEKKSQSNRDLRELEETAEFHLQCCDLVFRWRNDRVYIDQNGSPLRLPLRGGKPSFESLASSQGITAPEQYAGYLEALGATRKTREGHIELVSDSVLACSGNQRLTVAPHTVLSHVLDFVSTVRFNLETNDGDQHRRFERACFGRISPSYIPILQRLVEERGQNLIDGVDEWLARNASTVMDASASRLVGVGAYMYVRGPRNTRD